MEPIVSSIGLARELDEYIVFIDPSKCMGCRSCEIACAIEHSRSRDLFKAIREKPRPMPRIYVVSTDSLSSMPMKCLHCRDAPCISVCPSRALYRSLEGYVLVEPTRCIGCLMCMIACPFGNLKYSIETRAIIKCDSCYERVRRGELPACVEACPTGALRYGRLRDILEDLSRERARQIMAGVYTGMQQLHSLRWQGVVGSRGQ